MAEVTISRLEKFDIGKEYGSFEFGDISRQIGTWGDCLIFRLWQDDGEIFNRTIFVASHPMRR